MSGITKSIMNQACVCLPGFEYRCGNQALPLFGPPGELGQYNYRLLVAFFIDTTRLHHV